MSAARHAAEGAGRRSDEAPAQIELSVVVAARNAAATLREQLDALAAQRPGVGWEIVVCDNASTDGTAELVRAMTADLPELRLVDASGVRGPGPVRNVGAAAARGRNLLFCDADDVVGEGWVAAMRAALVEHTFVAGRFEGERLNDSRTLRSRVLPQQNGLQAYSGAPQLPHAGAGNMGVRADVFRRVGGFSDDAICLEDIDLCWRIQLSGEPLVFVPDALLYVRLRSGLRGAARQGFSYGVGQRWIEARYRDVLRLSGSVAATAAVPPRSRHWVHRVVGRGVSVGRSIVRIRSVGELAAFTWDIGWGFGHAFGRVPPTEPFEGALSLTNGFGPQPVRGHVE